MPESESNHSYEQDTAESSSDSENDIAPYSYEPSTSDSTTTADDSEAEDSNSVDDRLTDSSW